MMSVLKSLQELKHISTYCNLSEDIMGLPISTLLFRTQTELGGVSKGTLNFSHGLDDPFAMLAKEVYTNGCAIHSAINWSISRPDFELRC
ncbi:unnamed protein product, partial [Iphiclides podalirius]